jgi:hypothetical protein
MKKASILITMSLLLAGGIWADSHYQYIYWDTEVYFGHVIYPEARYDGKDAVVLREGQARPEVADLNLPIAPGDLIQTTERRCEIQFDTGTIIRLDRNTVLKIETILAQSLSSKNKLTNFILSKGQVYVMYKRYIRKEIFQIITPNAAVKMDHKSVAMIKAMPDRSTDIHVNAGKVYALFGPHEDQVMKEKIKKGQTISVTADHRFRTAPFVEIEDFEAWNEKLNREFLELHKGKALIPLPIQKMPLAVFHFAQKFSNIHGEWLWDGYFGYVWRPFLNDQRYPWGDWKPYYTGRWTSVDDQLFWVPTEPWGWVPYHLGIWTWDSKKGWLWIPGSFFAPAWVDWAFYFGRFGWRPWMFEDWLWYSYSGFDGSYFPFYASLDYRQSNDSTDQKGQYRKVHRVIGKDQLSRKESSPYPFPKEWKKSYKKMVAALEKGDEKILTRLQRIPEHVSLVNKEDLNTSRVHEKASSLADLSTDEQRTFISQRTDQDSNRLAVDTYSRNERVASLRDKFKGLIRIKEDHGLRATPAPNIELDTMPPGQMKSTKSSAFPKVNSRSLGIRSMTFEPKTSAGRFRDWNPDISVARKVGISIQYSSRSNEVRCPELNMTSRHVTGSRGYSGPRIRLSSSGSVVTSVSSVSMSSTRSSGEGSSGASSSTQSRTGSSARSSGKSASSKKGKK